MTEFRTKQTTERPARKLWNHRGRLCQIQRGVHREVGRVE